MPSPRALFVAEPAAVWAARPALVVDCSVVVAALFDETDADDATRALAGRALHAPALLPFEFANVARSKSRSGAPAERVAQALQTFDELRIELHPLAATELHALALAHGLTAYDAAYLALAKALRAPLLTFDLKLADAAARALGTPE
ncbi:MAG: type II toxin-antitoxin system VapC family toxin [Rubrivivax sp.]|nr:type II toxin-antitoxin system VapC family toxin [Rubrivivax sp.]